MSDFSEKVYQIVKTIPSGKVLTYKKISELLGVNNSYQAIGNALHKNPTPIIIPCHRVVNSKGFLAKSFGFGGIDSQKELLEKEGVKVINYQVNLDDYLY